LRAYLQLTTTTVTTITIIVNKNNNKHINKRTITPTGNKRSMASLSNQRHLI